MLRHFKKYFLSYSIVLLLILALAASYLRFMVQYDYLVLYEGPCDPGTQQCFMYCEDDSCSEPLYYSWIERSAHELMQLCGEEDVLTCEAAAACGTDEAECTITYCDPVTDTDCALGTTNNSEGDFE